MNLLPDVFQDPVLVQRQAVLDGQFKSLNAIVGTCDNVPSSTWVEWTNDYKNWSEFFDSGSNWSMSSKRATDEWQEKLQLWSNRMASYGCGGTLGSVDGINVVSATGDKGIPTVKDAPPNDPTFIDEALATVHKVTDPVTSTIKTSIWLGAGVVLFIVVAIAYILTRGKASGYGLKVGS